MQTKLIPSVLAQLILEAINAYGESVGQKVETTQKEIEGLLSHPPEFKMGHFAFPCFLLSKAYKKSPAQIATELEKNFPKTDAVLEVKGLGPYLNISLKPEVYFEKLISPILSQNYFKGVSVDNKTSMMIEYSQPNTHKVLHVGHMRNLCLGNSLIRLNRYVGHDVTAATYPGDVGTHVAKCLWYLKKHYKGEIPSGTKEQKGAWLGELYTISNNKLEDELGSDKEAENRTELTAILKELEQKSGPYFDLWKETREWSLALMNQAYTWADVKFDRWFFESEVDSPSLEFAKKLFEEGKLVKDQGAIGMDLTEDKLGFCLLIKSDGTGLYATKDIELARKKFEEFGIKKNIYIVDNRQAHHFKQVFKVLEKIGFEEAKDCYHLPYDVVELPDGAMSSRKGNIVALMDLVSKMEATITENYLEKYRGDWSDEEIKSTATIIANGAIKYGMIRVDNNRKIVFDMNEWLKLDGETGPYLQYVHARIHSMGEKLKATVGEASKEDFKALTAPLELELLVKLSDFNTVVLNAATGLKTMALTNYLFELGKLFNSFYAEHSISKESNPAIQKARLALSLSTGLVIKQGLELLGIKAPARM